MQKGVNIGGRAGIFSSVGSSLQAVVGLLVGTGRPGRSALEEEVTAFYDAFRGPLLRYLASMRIAPADGEEIVQEVFLALFRHLRDGKSRANLRGWLFRVAHNLALKNRMAKVRHAVVEASGESVDPGMNPEQLAVGNQRQARLLAVLRALPEQDQYCLSLRAEGFRYREIAEILGISLGSVANALERSLSRLSRAGGEA